MAVARTPAANAILFKKPFGKRVVQYESVDVNLPIIRELNGTKITFIGTIRNAAEKSLAEIQAELTHYQRCPPEESFAIQRIEKFARMPFWLARLAHWWMTWSPNFYIKNVGTCALTFAPQPEQGGSGFVESDRLDQFFPIGPTTAAFCIVSVRREPVVVGDEIVIRRTMKCSGMIDNFVLSGFEGARLVMDFQDLLTSGSFIEDELRELGDQSGAESESIQGLCTRAPQASKC